MRPISDSTYSYDAEDYITPPYPLHRDLYATKMIKHLRAAEAVDILDAGCGGGDFAEALAKEGFRIWGCDLNEEAIAASQSRRVGTFKVASLYDPFSNAFGSMQFDSVIAVDVIEHLYSPRTFVARAREALKTDGLLIITTPYWGYFKNIALAVTNRMDRALTVLWDGGHIKHFSRKTLTKLIEHGGFRAVAFEGCGIGIRNMPYLWGAMLMVFRKN